MIAPKFVHANSIQTRLEGAVIDVDLAVIAAVAMTTNTVVMGAVSLALALMETWASFTKVC